MAVFRIEKTRDYTVMSNHHLRNAGLSLKSKGLLSMMLSLPEDWNYTTRGLRPNEVEVKLLRSRPATCGLMITQIPGVSWTSKG